MIISLSSSFPRLQVVSAFLWLIALIIYTYAIAIHVRSSTPPCPCEEYVEAFLPFNRSAWTPPLGDDKHCYDAVRWALQQDAAGKVKIDTFITKDVKQNNLTVRVNGTIEVRRKSHKAGKNGTFYGRRYNGSEPLDKEIYLNYFVGEKERRGIFVEVGAGDGTRDSVTKFFEETLGWVGLLIDGGTRIKSRNSVTKGMKEVICSPEMEGKRLKWIGKGKSAGLETYMSEAHVKKHEVRWGRDWKKKARNVTCMALGTALEKSGIGVADLLVVSVNGAEKEVLSGLDEDKVHVRVIVVEVGIADGSREREIRKTLLEKGFCFSHRMQRNELWVGDEVLKLRHCAWAALKNDP